METLYLSILKILGGGAVGAIITWFYNWYYKERIPPIGIRIKTNEIFKKVVGEYEAKIVFTDKIETQFNNLFISNIDLINKSNKTIPEFIFGLNLKNEDKAVYCEIKSKYNNFREVVILNDISPINPSNNIKFKIKPFNRKDEYNFKIYIVVDKNNKPSEITPLTAEDIKWVDLESSEKKFYFIAFLFLVIILTTYNLFVEVSESNIILKSIFIMIGSFTGSILAKYIKFRKSE